MGAAEYLSPEYTLNVHLHVAGAAGPLACFRAPYEPFLEFFVELVPEGALTPRIWDLKIEDVVLIRNRIVGKFTLDDESGMNRHLMAGTVTGIAPYISMARAQRVDLKDGKSNPHQFAIIAGASRSWELGVYKDELTEIARDSWLNFVLTVSRPWEDTDWKGETGRAEDVLRKCANQFGFDYTNAIGYACGHPQMIENTQGILERARFPKEHIKEEKFFIIKDN